MATTMTPRELAGAIRRNRNIYVFAEYGTGDDHYLWLPVSKSVAHMIVEDASETGCREIEAEEIAGKDGGLYIGEIDWSAVETPGEGGEGEDGAAEEEEEEERED